MKKSILLLLLVCFSGISNSQEWIKIPDENTNILYSVHFPDDNTGYTVGSNGTILKFTDGGNSLINTSIGTINDLFSICFQNADTGFAAGANGTILKTINGGNTWITQTSGTQSRLNSVFLLNTDTMYIAGNGE